MTAYVAGFGIGGAGGVLAASQIGLLANTYQIRIVKVEFFTINNVNHNPVLYKISSFGMTGGTTITPTPIREGSAPSAATAKAGTTNISTAAQSLITVSGTASLVHEESGQTQMTYQFPFDLILSPGSGFFSQVGAGPGSAGSGYCYFMAVYYDELHLGRSR